MSMKSTDENFLPIGILFGLAGDWSRESHEFKSHRAD